MVTFGIVGIIVVIDPLVDCEFLLQKPHVLLHATDNNGAKFASLHLFLYIGQASVRSIQTSKFFKIIKLKKKEYISTKIGSLNDSTKNY